MSRLCLIGVGTPSLVPADHHAGPGLRSGHLAAALADAGHSVLLASVYPRTEPLPDDVEVSRCKAGSVRCVSLHEHDLAAEHNRSVFDGFAPDAWVGVTAYGAALAARLRPRAPLWADIFGDLMAEAQAKALRAGSDACLVHFWSLLAPVLARADRFSAVSAAQSHALIGQLGLSGRLVAATAEEPLVHVIPCAAEAEEHRPVNGYARDAPTGLRGMVVPEDARLLLWSGGFNTWCDVETMVAGTAQAMRADPKLYFVATGGAIAGHDETSYARFLRCVRAAGLGPRFHALGWVDSRLLPHYYAEADYGLVVERDLYERRFGSENRAVQWAAHGLPSITTARSELGAELVVAGAAVPISEGGATAVAAAIARAFADPEQRKQMRARARAVVDERYTYAATAAPLLDWAADPVHAGDAGAERALEPGLLSEPEALAGVLEAYLAGLSLPQLARRSSRWLWRRVRLSV